MMAPHAPSSMMSRPVIADVPDRGLTRGATADPSGDSTATGRPVVVVACMPVTPLCVGTGDSSQNAGSASAGSTRVGVVPCSGGSPCLRAAQRRGTAGVERGERPYRLGARAPIIGGIVRPGRGMEALFEALDEMSRAGARLRADLDELDRATDE